MGAMQNTFGHFTWTPPDWAQRLGIKKLSGLILMLVALALVAFAAYRYYQSLPVPPRVVSTAVAPGISPVVRNVPQPQPVVITFAIKTDPRQPVEGSSAIARVDLINTTLDRGISLSPSLPGAWQWISDTQLRFAPEQDWPADTTYTVKYTEDLFAPGLEFENTTVEFTTPEFSANIYELTFYQDPVDNEERKLVATLSFSHVVDAETVKKALSLGMRKDGQTVTDTPVALTFDVTTDTAARTAYVHSQRLDIPKNETFATLTVDERMTSKDSTDRLNADLIQTVRIPDVSSYFKIANSQFLLARDENDVPQQTVTLSFTDRVSTAGLQKKLTVYKLPKSVTVNGQTNSMYWESATQVTPDILSQATSVPFTLNPQETGSASLHSIRMDAPVGAYYYVRVEKGLQSNGEFVLGTPYDTVFYMPAYPEEVKVAQDGAILPLTGSHKVHFVSRGVKALKIEVGRLLESDVNHLASQTDGDIKDARFSTYRFDQDNLTEREVRYITLPFAHPKKASFAHLDLSEYLDKGGYYFLRVSGWDAQRKYETGVADQRIVLITDLGFIAKTGANGDQNLFVHSLSTGLPVSGAVVSLLGKNGLPVLSATTSADGHARMSSAQEFVKEKAATVYVVRKGSDSVFMPYGRYTRQLDFSRFDTSGEYSADGNQLRAQLFTERDLFRPGDVVHLAAIVKRGNWEALDRLPLRWIVRDPRGQTMLDLPLRLPADGFIEHTLQTDPASSTGNYEVALYTIDQRNRRRYLGGHQFKIEEFQPDRLRIRSEVSGQKAAGWIKPDNLTAEVQLDNLFGTPASNRRIQGSMRLRPASIYFNDYPDFVFTDPLRNDNVAAQTVERKLKPTTTDENGAASLPLNIGQYDGGLYELNVYTEGFEAGGGRSVKSNARIMVSPLDYLVGFKARGSLEFVQKESARSIELVALDSDAQNVKLESLSLQLLERQYVSSLIKQNDGTFAYQSISKDSLLTESPYSISTDGENWPLPTEKAGRFVVQILDARKNVLSRIPFTVAGARNLAGNLEQNAELDLSLDKESYAPGEMIQLQITAPYNGTGLITIERDSVLSYKWFRASTNSSMQSIRVPDQLEGNAYVNVAFMRGLDSPEIYLNPLSYALKPFSIKRDARTVAVSLDVPETVVPGQALSIEYKTDKPSRIVVFAVDQGILQVAKYQRPKPLDFFLRKRALRVSTYQIADLVLPEFVTGKRSAAPGGGEAAGLVGENLNPFKRKTDAPVVYWSGVLDAGPAAKSTLYNVPDYFNGELTIMAVAVRNDAVGDAQVSTKVKGPFVISPNLPVSVSPGDEFDVSVGLANNVKGSGEQASISLVAEPSEHLTLLADPQKTLSIDEGRENSTIFKVRVNDTPGSASLRFTAKLGGTASTLNSSVSVRPATPFRTTLQSAAHTNDPVELTLQRKLYKELSTNSVAASVDPIILADGLQQYLDGFPHACAEQIVSKVFPQIGLYSNNAQFDDNRIRTQFSELTGKLRARQLPNGGFRFWQASTEAADFPSVYISHFLTEAKDVELPVSNRMMQSAQTFLRELAARNTSTESEARLRAYAIYVLTRNGVVTTNYLTSLQEYLQTSGDAWEKDITAIYMAASYQLLKLDDLAGVLAARYELQGGNEMFSDFDTRLGRDAQYVYLLAKHFPERLTQLGASQLQTLITPVMQNRFNTLSSAYTILALQAYGEAATREETTGLTLTAADGTKLSIDAVIARANFGLTRSVTVSGGGDRTVFTTLTQAGFDSAAPPAAGEGLEIDRRYLDSDGDPVTEAELGDELTVQLRIRSDGRPRTNVAVVDLLPGGFEVLTDSVRRQYDTWSADYTDVREDRVVTYGTFTDRLSEIRYTVKVTAAGTFTVPAAYASSMYDPTVQANTASAQFVVTRPAK
ncbi:MAG: alpha-2-macroglobulin [Gammaproteobacteria bacterium]